MNKIKLVFCLLLFLFETLNPVLKLESGYSISSIIKVEQKIDNIGKVNTRPIIKTKVIYNEKKILREKEILAQLVMAEAGNQDLTGKRYVVDVVLNRVNSDQFPDTIEDVIFQKNQFSVIKNGGFNKAKYIITEECYEAVNLEYKNRLNYDILYFGKGKSKYANNHFKWQDHWFGW